MKYGFLLLLLVTLLNPIPALAYIDPGSGSAIMSAIIGFLVAVGFAVKTYWFKLKALVTGKKSVIEEHEGSPSKKI